MKPTDWIDRVAAKNGGCSDYRVAQILKISKQAVSKYRHGVSIALDDAIALRVEGELGLPLGSVVTDQRAEREQDADVKAFWQRLGKIAAQTVAGVVVAVCALTTGVKPVQAKVFSYNSKAYHTIDYANLFIALRRAWATLKSQLYRSVCPWNSKNYSPALA